MRDKRAFEAHLEQNDDIYEYTPSRYRDLLRILEQVEDVDSKSAWKYAGIIALSESGWTTSGIAKRFDASEGTIGTWFEQVQEEANLDEDMWFREVHPKTYPSDKLWPDGYENPHTESAEE